LAAQPGAQESLELSYIAICSDLKAIGANPGAVEGQSGAIENLSGAVGHSLELLGHILVHSRLN